MNLLKIIKEARHHKEIISNHPARHISILDKTNYINGISILMNIDENIAATELEYLGRLIASLDLPEDKIDEFIRVAEAPETDLFEYLMKDTFSTRLLKYAFLIDCDLLIRKDGIIHENETVLVARYARTLGISAEEQERLNNVVHIIIEDNGNWPEDLLASVDTSGL